MKRIVIVGSGGFAKEVAFLIDDINRDKKEWILLGFINENKGCRNGKYFVYETDEWLINTTDEINVVFGIGDPLLIKKLEAKFSKNENIKYPTLIHPSAIGDFERISFGIGNIVTAGNIFTTDIKIGSFNTFNLDCTIGHDIVIGNFNVINPSVNISGGVEMKEQILIGTGVQILQYKKICSNTIIGAGSVVTRDITEGGIYVGSPARKIK